jgi:DUF4097 and DUF4098 domain-containing protein YvlB
MGTFVINGRKFITDGNIDSINIINGQVSIDGQMVEMGDFAFDQVINIVVEGPVNSLTTSSGDVTVNGDAKSVKSSSGDIKVKGDVKGDASTVSGDVSVNGSIVGKVKTVSGDIRYSKFR